MRVGAYPLRLFEITSVGETGRESERFILRHDAAVWFCDVEVKRCLQCWCDKYFEVILNGVLRMYIHRSI